MRVVEEEGGRKMEGISKVWANFKEQRFCTETEMATPDGKRTKYVTIQADGKVYVLNVETKTAQEIPYLGEGSSRFDWGKTPDYKRFGGIAVGTDTVAGRETDIYEYIKFEDRFQKHLGQQEGVDELKELMAKSANQIRVRQWIWRGTDFPLKTILDYGTKRVITETMHIAVNVNIPERVFKVPGEYTVKKTQR